MYHLTSLTHQPHRRRCHRRAAIVAPVAPQGKQLHLRWSGPQSLRGHGVSVAAAAVSMPSRVPVDCASRQQHG